jgi:predicted membrane channel-forming protein YqfA (hemolysin III family)
MLLYILAVVFALIGLLFLVASFLSEDTLGTKIWGMSFLIISAATCLLKSYLANPEPVNSFFRSILSK